MQIGLFLVLIPKGTCPEDSDNSVYRSVDQIRPLSLSNSDVKIFEMALCCAWEEVISSWALRAQRGFIRGRSMLKNVLEVESKSLVLSLSSYNSEARPGTLLFDFGNAFPSLAHEFLWLTLESIGVPASIINAVKRLYSNSKHFWKYRGITKEVYVAEAGVKQGGPLSALLFVIAIDAFLASLGSVILPDDLLTAFADDVAVVTENLWLVGPSVALRFHEFSRVSNLKLKPAKCVLIPLWLTDVRNIKTLLQENIPLWSEFLVAMKAKYLGVWIGPSAADASWHRPAAKFESRCRQISQLGLGMWISAALYNSIAITSLGFVSQISAPPPWVMQLERRMLALIAKGPHGWLPHNLNFALDAIGLPGHFRSLRCISLAGRGRVLLQELPDWRDLYDSIQENKWLHSLHGPGPFCWNDWLSKSISRQLKEASSELHALSILTDGRIAQNLQAESDKQQINTLIYSHVRKNIFVDNLAATIEPRLRRWCINGERCISAEIVFQISAQLRTHVAPCVLAALLHTWLNGWCTTRRFQQQASGCLFGCLDGADEVEHYTICPRIWQCAEQCLKLNPMSVSTSRSLLATPQPNDNMTLLALHNFAALGCHNYLKHNPGSSSSLLQIYKERVRKAAVLHKGTARAIRELYA